MSDVAKERPGLRLALVVAAVAVVAGFVALLVRAQRMPSGVVPITWDREACAHCRMHIGEPAFAAQAQLVDGSVHSFDDPGCLLRWLESPPSQVRALYLRHAKEDRWLTREQAAFATVEHSPMGFGLGAVDAATPGALTWEDARRHVLATHGGGTR